MMLNLHSHLEGRVRPVTAADIGARLRLPEPATGWQRALELDGPADLTVYLEKVSATYPFFADYDALSRIAREAVEDAAADGNDYLELRFGPASHTHDDFGLDDVIAAVCEGVADGVAITGIDAGVLVAALRLHSESLNEAVARAAVRGSGHGVVGFDLAGDELRYPDLTQYANCFAIARAGGLGLTCHAAEAAAGTAALEAVELFGVTRIGHGAHIVDDPRVLERFAALGVAVEVCPSSNRYTGAISDLRGHPAPKFRDAAIAVVLGDDNPRQTGSLLSNERAILRDRLGFDERALRKLDVDSVAYAFLTDAQRSALTAKLGQAAS